MRVSNALVVVSVAVLEGKVDDVPTEEGDDCNTGEVEEVEVGEGEGDK
jgi:hypothetical protein